MKNNTLTVDASIDNVIDFEEATAKSSGSHGGFDYFSGMTVGTRFACFRNGNYGSICEEYILLQKSGPTVLLLNTQINDDVHWATAQERHLGQKFWKMHTMVQILHDPEKDKNNGNRVPN
jgi:hypothetical protein